MMRVFMVAAGGVSAALFAGLLVAAWTFMSAQDALGSAALSSQQMIADVTELEQLRATQPQAFLGDPPNEAVISAARQVARDAGLVSQTIGGVALAAERSVSNRETDASIKTRTVRVDLRDLTPPELGRFLETWSRAQPLWIPVDIKLIAAARSPGRYTVQLTLEARYVQQLTTS